MHVHSPFRLKGSLRVQLGYEISGNPSLYNMDTWSLSLVSAQG